MSFLFVFPPPFSFFRMAWLFTSGWVFISAIQCSKMDVVVQEAQGGHLLSYLQLSALYLFACGVLFHAWILYKMTVICGNCCGSRRLDPIRPIPRHEEGRIWARGHGNQILMAPYKPYPPSFGSRENPDEWSLVNLVRRRRWSVTWRTMTSTRNCRWKLKKNFWRQMQRSSTPTMKRLVRLGLWTHQKQSKLPHRAGLYLGVCGAVLPRSYGN